MCQAEGSLELRRASPGIILLQLPSALERIHFPEVARRPADQLRLSIFDILASPSALFN